MLEGSGAQERSREGPSTSTLIFIHIPKCGGVTLGRIINQLYPAGSRASIDSMRPLESTFEFQALPLEQKAHIRVLKGHMCYGLHEYLPGECTYITLLRDPVDRLISHYYYVKRTPHHYLYDAVVGSGMSLEDYLESEYTLELINAQVRHLSGLLEPDLVLEGEAGERALALAKENLVRNVAAVGLTERFDESVLLFRKVLGWSWPVYLRANVTKDRPRGRDVPKRAMQIAADRNRLDIELYEIGKRRFEEALEAHGIGSRDLAVFRALNKGYDWKVRMSRASGARRIRRLFQKH